MALVQDTGGKFIFSDINDLRVEELYIKLLSTYEMFQELDDRHIEYASPGTDEQKAKFIEDEGIYAKNVALLVSTVVRKYCMFKAALEAAQNKARNERKLSSLKNEVLR